MKKLLILSLAVATAVLSACNGEKVNFNVCVTGAEDGTIVSLIDKLSGDVLKSGEIKDGELKLAGKADKDALLYIQKEGSNWQNIFFADGQDICINLEDNSLTGSKLNEKLTACDKEVSNLYNAVINDISEFNEIGGTLSETEQAARIEVINDKIASISDMYNRILQENTDNIIPAAFISELAQSLEGKDQDELFNADCPYAKHPYVLNVKKQIDEFNAKMAEAESVKDGILGQQFIDLEEPDVKGKMHKLSEFAGRGKWVFVDFWASWCGPCRREMPNVVAAYKKYHPKGLEIVGLSFDSKKDDWVKAIKDLDMPWIHLSDLKGWETVASDTYGIKSIPASLLINPDGIIVARDLRGNELGNKLAEIFGE